MSTTGKNPMGPASSQLLAIEVISGLLASTSMDKLCETLADHLREITGARTVMILSHRPEPAHDELLHVSPARRRNLFTPTELNLFCHEKTPGELPSTPEELPEEHPLKTVLLQSGIQSMVRYSLHTGGELVGLLLLLDLPGMSRIVETNQIVTLLAPPIALALKNALSYFRIEQLAQELEQRVEERTTELTQSQAFLKTAIDSSPIPIMIHDEDDKVLQLSKGWTRLSGYSLDDIPTLADWTEKAYGERTGSSKSYIDGLFEIEKTVCNGEWTVTAKDGSTRVWDFQTTPLGKVRNGRRVLLSMATDITERRLAELEIRETKAMLQAAMDCSPSGIAIASAPDGKLLYVNDAGLLIRGGDRQTVVNGVGIDQYVASWQLLDLDSRPLRTDEVPLARAITFGETNSREFIIRRDDNDDRVVFANAAPIRDDAGNIQSGIVVFADITDHKRAEMELEKNRRQYRDLVEGTPDLVARVDNEGRFTFVNHTALKIFGLSPKECIGRLAFDFIHPDDRDSTIAAFESWKHSEEVFTHENRQIAIDGQGHYHMVWSIHAERDESGSISGFAGTARDITEHKHASEEKEKLESQLQQAQKMESVGRLAGGVAHDFNNMLSVILGHAELGLMHLEPNHPVCADLKEISKTAQRSADLTRQLLAFARKQTVAPKVLDVNATISEMLKMLQRLIGENIHLTWQPAPDLWQIRMDPSQIDQILANLCVNARDAIDSIGRITIETANATIDTKYCLSVLEATPGEYVCLTVSDSGRGMNKETQAQIFEPFYTTKELGKGTGLGLATVYGAVKQNNGFINIYSEPGKGTTFSIYLPRDESCRSSQTLPVTVAAPVPRGQETILLVEDEPAILDMAAMMLEMQGYTVLKADTPGEALRLAGEQSGDIQLLMTDVIMPEMNGRDLARNLLSLYPDMKRLFMSGYTADVIASNGVLEDGVHFIQKPFSLPNMAVKVREVLDSK